MKGIPGASPVQFRVTNNRWESRSYTTVLTDIKWWQSESSWRGNKFIWLHSLLPSTHLLLNVKSWGVFFLRSRTRYRLAFYFLYTSFTFISSKIEQVTFGLKIRRSPIRVQDNDTNILSFFSTTSGINSYKQDMTALSAILGISQLPPPTLSRCYNSLCSWCVMLNNVEPYAQLISTTPWTRIGEWRYSSNIPDLGADHGIRAV
jgi:hypothetical protein